jgi:hypothetical protein
MLDSEQRRILDAVLDAIVPPSDERGLSGAGEVGVGDHVATALEGSPDMAPAVTAGLSALGGAFVALDAAARSEAINGLAATQPGFMPVLLFLTYQGYYQNPSVLEALGMPPRAPHPLGYEMEPSDLTLLEPVKTRGKFYRETP